MPQFQWKGTKPDGERAEGVVTANNKEGAITLLRRQRIVVSSVKEKGKEMALPKIFQGSIPQKNVAIFTRQFSVMIDAGLPLVQCLEILGSQQENKSFQRILFAVREDVEAGQNLAAAMIKHPRAFNNLYCAMIAAGEAGGILDTILQRLSAYIEKAVKLKAKVKGAMIYPVVIVTVAVLVIVIIMWKVVPVFADLFMQLGAKLPTPTRIVISISNFVGSFWWLMGLTAIVLSVGYKTYYGTEQGRIVIDRIKLKMPILGDLLKKVAVAGFCRTLGTLVSSGVPILDGLEICAKTSGNAIIEGALLDCRAAVGEGRTLADPLIKANLFPGMVTQMINVGEQTGALDAMLAKIADFYDDEVDTAVASLMSLLEPVMIVFLGCTVGGIVIAMYLPMFTLIGQID